MNHDSQTLSPSVSTANVATADILPDVARYATSGNPQIAALNQYSLWEITGADAAAFLQGQFCNDLSLVSPTQAQITGYCTPKGRLLALPTIVGCDSGYRLIVPSDVAEAFIKRLRMFVMRSDVTVTPLSDWMAIGITGDVSGNIGPGHEHLGALPTGALAAASSDDSQLIRWHDDYSPGSARARYLSIAPMARQELVLKAFADAEQCPAQTWQLADISAGVPSITHGVLEAFVPQMINLQLINALSFTKGCYPGQEIVARMQYLGKLKRHMCLFEVQMDSGDFDMNEALRAGATLSCGSDQNAGIVVDAMPVSRSIALVLAVTKVTASEDSFSLHNAQLVQRALPYKLPTLLEGQEQE